MLNSPRTDVELDALDALVQASRLIGADRSLVLYGGGNTSLKLGNVLHVKGTGSDLAHVDAASFTPLHLHAARAVLAAACENNAAMMYALDACLVRRLAPKPSIETLLHASLPHACVFHTHASAALAALNVQNIEEVHAAVFGELAPLVPYQHSGHALARACMTVFETNASPQTIGLALAYHGIVSFGTSVREAHQRMMMLVTRAEDYLKARDAWALPDSTPAAHPAGGPSTELRQRIRDTAGKALVCHVVDSPLTRAFAARADLAVVSQQGPSTPQHAVYTRRVPLVDGDVTAFAQRYCAYLSQHLGHAATKMDAAPRIVLDPAYGFAAFGDDAHRAAMAAAMYQRDIETITRASAHGCYRSAPLWALAMAEYEYGGY